MPWTEVSINVAREGVADAERGLEEAGALAVTLEDDADDPVLEPGPGETPLWPTVHLRGLFEAGVDRSSVLFFLKEFACAVRPEHIRWREVGDEDWERAWMDRFEPMRFGDRLWIVPTGMTGPADPAAVCVRLDPGLAFGTGTHPTTALCLEWLDRNSVHDVDVVDYGCGSGVLGIAAALLGASSVEAVDNDPQALEATAVNAGRNGVSERVRCVAPEDFRARNAGAVLANILAGPLIELASLIHGCASPGAPIVLSGLLEEQVEDVVAAYRPGCRLLGTCTRDGWSRVALEKA